MHINRQKELKKYLQNYQQKIISAFNSFETQHQFTFTPWNYSQGEGGGIMGKIRGEHFEKAAVNFSSLNGSRLPGSSLETEPFYATGVSLITHMSNPHAPTVHMNVRYIETKDRFWFGGGYDLTPMGISYPEDTSHFHKTAQQALDPHGNHLYPQFAKQAEKYFYIPHRKKERGVGGIFFDHFNTENYESDLALWKSVADSFLKGIIPIYEKRIHLPYTKTDKQNQMKLRGHYVEFNLVYDRGTRFGFESGGNPEAILSSMPPLASW